MCGKIKSLARINSRTCKDWLSDKSWFDSKSWCWVMSFNLLKSWSLRMNHGWSELWTRGMQSVALLGMLILGTLPCARADIDDIMRQSLGSLSNATAPYAGTALDRGIYYGGSYNLRNQITQLQLLSFDARYIAAGCGGIDLYAGSFSYINKEQFNQLLRSVASNAVGYSFSLALNHVCPSCAQTVESLQRKIQQINQHLGNSCALAQGLVNDTIAAFSNSKNNKISLQAHLQGLGDTFTTFSSNQAEIKEQVLHNAQTKDQLYGNVVYKALLKAYGKTYDQTYLEQIMSLTGTIVSTPAPNKGNSAGQPDPQTIYAGELISLRGLISGGKVSVYTCLNAECTRMRIVASTRESTAQRIKRLYLGADAVTDHTTLIGRSTQGLIGMYENNQGVLTQAQRNELSLVGQGINAQIRSLAILSPDAARNYVQYATNYIALRFAQHEIDQAFRLVNNALNSVAEDDNITAVRKLVAANHSKYLTQLQTESATHNVKDIQAFYESLLNTLTNPQALKRR